jgi:cobalt-zinc-cadmium efflux system protein
MACSHHHAHHEASATTRAFALSVGLNAVFVVVELVAGNMANSLALIADAIHNLGDVLALLVAWLGHYLSQHKPTRHFTYGMGRFSIFAALFNGFTLVGSAIWIGFEAVGRLITPLEPLHLIVGIVAAIGIAVNTTSALLLARGKDDLNLKAAMLHMAGDAGISAGVVLAAIIMSFTGWGWVDPGFGLVIAAVIFWSGIPVLREGAALAMDGVPQELNRDEILGFLNENNDIKSVHDLHIWGLSTTNTALTAHLEAKEGVALEPLQRQIHRALSKRFKITHITLQLEKDHSACLDTHEEADI